MCSKLRLANGPGTMRNQGDIRFRARSHANLSAHVGTQPVHCEALAECNATTTFGKVQTHTPTRTYLAGMPLHHGLAACIIAHAEA